MKGKELTKFLKSLNDKGYVKYKGVIYVAAGAILKASLGITSPEEIDVEKIKGETPLLINEEYVSNLSHTKILVTNDAEINLIKEIFSKFGRVATDKKFIKL